ncbi:class I cytochrome c [Paucibacter sediminis]|uniref:Class I cytochrome c n=1 Tax=Paucibacter sediminis TaxID=3019553 RepID=A0AA95NFW8_9BURK|nr:c-type cytochrome [Paucibacter sp. S2-9]WIT12167.1 class I cytochrome c [Paucibacter sp. S2-9]
MKYDTNRIGTLAFAKLSFAAAVAFCSCSALAVDVAAAEQTARQNECFKCHETGSLKEGPSFKYVAWKYKADTGAAARIKYHLTSGEPAKGTDGKTAPHKIVKVENDAELINLIEWVLSR